MHIFSSALKSKVLWVGGVLGASTVFPAGAILPPLLEFPVESGRHAQVWEQETLPDGVIRWEGRVIGEKGWYRLEAGCAQGTVAMSKRLTDDSSEWELRYGAKRRGEGWERSTIEWPASRIPPGSEIDALATQQFDTVCKPKVYPNAPRAPQV